MTTVTVVMPLYNGRRKYADHLYKSIESVLEQTFIDFEFLIVDDGSSEDYSDLIKKYCSDPRIKWFHKENGGQSSARNYGAIQGTCKWLAFIDQDDIWYPQRLEKTVAAMTVNSSREIFCSLVYSDFDQIDADGNIIQMNFLGSGGHGTHPRRNLRQLISNNTFTLPGTMLIARKKFLEMGGFNNKLSGYEDEELAIRLFHEGVHIFISEPLIQWRIYPESYTYSERMEVSRSRFFSILCSRYSDVYTGQIFWVSDVIAPRFLREWAASLQRSLVDGEIGLIYRSKHGLNEVTKYLRPSHQLVARFLLIMPDFIIRFVLTIAKRLSYGK